MTANAQHDPGDQSDTRAADGTDGSLEFDELRSLIIGADLERLDTLGLRVGDPARRAEDIGAVLPEAIAISTRADERLSLALRPTVEEAVRVSVRRDSKVLVDALFPVMGPAIRRAVATALGELVQSLNRTLEHSLTIRGLKWRLEAYRTGRSFAEVVLSHSLVYRVEQAFLIHGETGLLLQHVVGPAVEAPDGDLFSGMLTAIQDFVRDSLNAGQTDTLNEARVGELTLWVERGPHAVIAGVIRGEAPQELRHVFVNAIEAIHLESADALEAFAGDAALFECAKPHLESCLEAQFEDDGSGEKPSKALLVSGVVLALVVLSLLGWWLYQRATWNGAVERLRATPGLVVVDEGTRDGRWYVSGLRDPLAPDPATLLEQEGIDAADVSARWEYYHSFAPEFLAERATAILNPPRGVALTAAGATVVASGEAPHAWIREARRLVKTMPGVVGLDESGLVDLDRREVNDLTQRLESTVVRFVTNTADIAETPEVVDAVARDLRALVTAAAEQNLDVAVVAVGHTDSSGTETTNSPLSDQRARRMVELLTGRGVPAALISTQGVATSRPVRPEATPDDAAFNRSVTFEVTVSDR